MHYAQVRTERSCPVSTISKSRPASSSSSKSSSRTSKNSKSSSSRSANRSNSSQKNSSKGVTQPKDRSKLSSDIQKSPNVGVPNFASAFTARPPSSASDERQAGEQSAATQGAPTGNPSPPASSGENPASGIRPVVGRKVNEAADWIKPRDQNGAIDRQAQDFRRDGHKVTPTTPEAVNERHLAERPKDTKGADERFKANQIEVGKKGLEGVRVTPFKPDPSFGPKNDFFATHRELAQAAQQARTSGATPAQVIQDRLALPKTPEFASPARVAPGTVLDQSVVGAQEFDKGRPLPGQGQQLKALGPVQVDASKTIDVNRAARQALTASEIADGARTAGKVLRPLGIASDALQVKDAIEKDGGTLGRNTAKAGLEIGGGWGGALGGAKLGALGGAAIGSAFPVVGTAIGGVVGGIVGGAIGGLAGSGLGRWVGSWF